MVLSQRIGRELHRKLDRISFDSRHGLIIYGGGDEDIPAPYGLRSCY